MPQIIDSTTQWLNYLNTGCYSEVLHKVRVLAIDMHTDVCNERMQLFSLSTSVLDFGSNVLHTWMCQFCSMMNTAGQFSLNTLGGNFVA